MRVIASILMFGQALIALIIFYRAFRRQQLFELAPVLAVALLLYITLPIWLCLPHGTVQVNGAMVPVADEALALAGVLGLLLAGAISALPKLRLRIEPKDLAWVKLIFIILAAINLVTLAGFLRTFDFRLAVFTMLAGAGAEYRDLAYESLIDSDAGLGYVPKVLQIALFGCLWISNALKRRYLLVGILPVLLLDILSLGRHTIASFLVVLFFGMERSGVKKKLYVVAPTVVLAIFFMRIMVFSATDKSYADWGVGAFSASSDGVEALGEFFNTFGTFLMLSSIDAAKFELIEILSMFSSQLVLPPGAGGFWHSLTESSFPLFRVSDLIKQTYGPHPAHLSLADVYTFGVFSIFGFGAYFAVAYWARRGSGTLAAIVYFYLLGMFYLPFRGSLTLNAMRFMWLIFMLLVARSIGRALVQRRILRQRSFLSRVESGSL